MLVLGRWLPCLADIPVPSPLWHSILMAHASPPPRGTIRCGCGTPRPDSRSRYWRITRNQSCGSPSVPTEVRLLTASFEHTVRVWDARTGQQIAILTHQGPVLAVISADQRIVTLDRDATLRLWDMDSFQQLAVINIPRQGDFAMKAMEDIA